MPIIPSLDGGVRMRWLLLGSLTLNLLFMGAAGAVALRYSSPVPLMSVARIEHGLASRLDRIAVSLPPADSEIMRAQLRADAEKIAAAQADLRLSQDAVRDSLRAELFDPETMRRAMAENRAAHDNFDQVLHDTIAAAAARMSVVGRTKIADWHSDRVRTAQ